MTHRDDTGGVRCPWCGETVTLVVDPGGAAVQRYVEDCPVCCRPWDVEVSWDDSGRVVLALSREGGT